MSMRVHVCVNVCVRACVCKSVCVRGYVRMGRWRRGDNQHTQKIEVDAS